MSGSVEPAAEQAAEHPVTEGGALGAIGVVVALILGFPRSHVTYTYSAKFVDYSNLWAGHQSFGEAVASCAVWCVIIGSCGASLGRGITSMRRRA